MFFGKEGSELHIFFRWAFYIFIALFPFLLYEGYLFNGTSTRAVNTVLFVELLALVLGIALLYKRQRLSFARSPVTVAFVLLLAALFVSSIIGADFHMSWWSKATRTTGLFYFVHMALLYFLFWGTFHEERSMRTFIKTFIVSTGIFSIASMVGQEGLGWLFESKPWSALTIGNSTFAGMYLFAAFMFSVYLIATQQKESRRWWKYLVPIVFVINPYIVNFDLWRGAVNVFRAPLSIIGSAQASSLTLFLSIVLLCAFWLGSKIKKATVRRALLLVAVAAGAVAIAVAARSLLTPGGKAQEFYLTQASPTRPIVWEFSKEAIAQRPAFGWGVDNFDVVFQKYYDSRILEQKNGGEAWLDRAHNIFVDQTIESGYVGMGAYILVYLALFGSLLYVLLRSRERNDLALAAVLLVYFFGHLLELQTAFDTTITYVPLLCFAAIAGILFHRTRKAVTGRDHAFEAPAAARYAIGAFFIAFAVALFFAGTVPIVRVETANGAIRRVGSSEKRIPMYKTLLSSPLDRGAFLWRTSNDIQRGVSLDPKMIEDPRQREGLKKELEVIVAAYESYLQDSPNDYRAILNLADIYIYQRLFEVDNLKKAHEALDHAVALVPQSPQAYWMKSVAYLYQAKFKEAREWAAKAYAVNPGVEESKRLVDYIDESVKAFPVIDLYSFRQI